MNPERFKKEYINAKNEIDKKELKDIIRSFSEANMDKDFYVQDP